MLQIFLNEHIYDIHEHRGAKPHKAPLDFWARPRMIYDIFNLLSIFSHKRCPKIQGKNFEKKTLRQIHRPVNCDPCENVQTKSLLRDFELQAANISSAKHILENFPDCSMLRRHPQPPPSNFEPLVMAGKNAGGFEIKLDDGKSLADSLNSATDPKVWP